MIQFDDYIFQMGWFNQLASNIRIFISLLISKHSFKQALQDDVEEEEAWAVSKL